MAETPAATQDLHARIDRALEELRPFLRSDGGDIQLVGILEVLVIFGVFFVIQKFLDFLTLRESVQK